MKMADTIRDYVNVTYIEPARTAGVAEVQVQIGDVHKALNLKNRLPAVSGAIGANIFETKYRVRLTSRTGPQNGSSPVFSFKVLD